jgi:predicted O-linked N-acetylglucosamine transferase (SPINDLY family)
VSAASSHKTKQARERLQQGDIPGAQSLCQQVLRSAPRNPEALCLLGMSQLMSGQPAEAVPLFEQVLSGDARNGMALEHLGLAHLMLGRFSEAEAALRRAVVLQGAPASVAMRLGVALLNQQQYAESIRYLEHSLARDPDSADGHLNLGRAYAQSGDTASARAAFETALRLQPGRADAAFNLGVLELQSDRLDTAQGWFERVLRQAPDYVDALVSLGIVLQRQGRLKEAHERFAAALRAAPGHPGAHEGLAFVCLALGRTGEVIEHLKAVLETDSSHRAALATLAETLFELGRLDEAAAVASQLRELYTADPAGYATLANVYIVRGELDRAIATLETGYAATNSGHLLGMLAYQLRHTCEWDKWRATWDKLAPELDRSGELGSPFWLLCEPASPNQLLEYTKRWADARFRALTASHTPVRTTRRHPRIRIGYLSSDFQEHAVGYLIVEALELHDRERFEVFVYSHGPDDKGTIRPRIRAASEHFVDIARDPDDIAAERIRNDELDILIDLKGYTAGDRLPIMARRPCDIQVTWLGYPGTTGASFIDYLIADPFIIPAELESAYSERILRMPHSYQPNDRKRIVSASPARAEYGLPDDAFVFCCFNQTFKITPEVFELWLRLLEQTPNSVLWLMDSNVWAKTALLARAERHGMVGRLVFAPKKPNAEHLARYRAADLALDTYPYTSHTTLTDALWLGCPVVALCGETFASRVSGSLLTSAGLSDLVTYRLVDHERLVHGLATDRGALHAIRERIARARDQSPLFDSVAFTRGLEKLYSQLVNQRSS